MSRVDSGLEDSQTEELTQCSNSAQSTLLATELEHSKTRFPSKRQPSSFSPTGLSRYSIFIGFFHP